MTKLDHAARPSRKPKPWKPVTRLDVFYEDDAAPRRVGGLALDRDRVIHFQYDASWLDSGLELSPGQLPLSVGQQLVPAPDPGRLHGLHGVFADALPDSWGMRILAMALRRQGLDPERAGPLDRLAYLGTRTMGALTFRPSTKFPVEARRALTLELLAAQAEVVYEGIAGKNSAPTTDASQADALLALERAAGSPGGAQPKVLIAISADGVHLTAGDAPAPDYTPYLLKFTPRRDGLGRRTDCGVLEEAYARMARAAGIDLPPTRLFETSDGRAHFAVERFDRTGTGGRRHMHTLGGLLGREAADDGDYDQLFRVAFNLTQRAQTREAVLRRLCFNVAALNDDDHLKNTAFLLEPSGQWRLSPAYDLTYSPGPSGVRGMAVGGHEAGVTWEWVDALATKHSINLTRVRAIRAEVQAAISEWPRHAHAAGVPAASVSELAEAFESRRRRLEL